VVCSGLLANRKRLCTALTPSWVHVDVRDTIDMLIEASNLPLYTIISMCATRCNGLLQSRLWRLATDWRIDGLCVVAGVGSADFTSLHKIAAAGPLLCGSEEQTCEQKCVELMEYLQLYERPSKFASQAVSGIPGKMMHYFKENNISPPIVSSAPEMLVWPIIKEREIG
jgi:hypothetical protein